MNNLYSGDDIFDFDAVNGVFQRFVRCLIYFFGLIVVRLCNMDAIIKKKDTVFFSIVFKYNLPAAQQRIVEVI